MLSPIEALTGKRNGESIKLTAALAGAVLADIPPASQPKIAVPALRPMFAVFSSHSPEPVGVICICSHPMMILLW